MRRVSPELLEQCLAEIQSGRSTVEACVEAHPEVAAELLSLLRSALALSSPSPVAPSALFRGQARAALVAEMARTAVTASPPERLKRRVNGASSFTAPRPALRRKPMFALASLLLIAITTLGGGSTAYAAQGALPGDVLYPLKIGLERAQAAATLNEEGRAQLHVRRAERRLEETARLLEQGRERDLGEALRRYGQEIEALGAALQGQPGSEPAKLHRGELAQRVAEATAKHLEVLERVEAKAPEQAQSALAHALEVSRKGHEQALSRVEEARERARERAPEERGPDRGQGQKRGQEDSQIEAATSKLEGTLVVSVAPGSGAVTATVGGVAVDLSQLGLTPAELQALNGRVVELEGISVGGSLLALELEREDRSRIERDKSASENKEEKATAKAEEEKAKAAAAEERAKAKAEEEKAKAAAAAERAKAKAEEEKAKAAAAAERAKAEAEEEKAKAAAAAERAKAKAEEKKAKEGNGDKDRDNGKDDDD